MFVPRFVKFWLFISSVIVVWDYSFVLLRPDSLPGGSLYSFYFPYAKYIQIDTLYGSLTNSFAHWTALLNCLETFIAFASLIVLLRKEIRCQILGAFMAFAVSGFTFWKTVLYCVYDAEFVVLGDSIAEFLGIFVIPNSFWVIMPAASMWKIWKQFEKFICEKEEALNKAKKSS